MTDQQAKQQSATAATRCNKRRPMPGEEAFRQRVVGQAYAEWDRVTGEYRAREARGRRMYESLPRGSTV